MRLLKKDLVAKLPSSLVTKVFTDKSKSQVMIVNHSSNAMGPMGLAAILGFVSITVRLLENLNRNAPNDNYLVPRLLLGCWTLQHYTTPSSEASRTKVSTCFPHS